MVHPEEITSIGGDNGSKEMKPKRTGPSGAFVPVDMMRDIHARVQEAPKSATARQLAKDIHRIYPHVTMSTMTSYCLVGRHTTDELLDLFAEGKLSYVMLKALSSSDLDAGTKNFLATEVIQQGFNIKQIYTLRRLLKGDNISISEALKRASGEIPSFEKSGEVRKVARQFKDIVDEISEASLYLRMKMRLAVELLPITILDHGEVHSKIFYESYLLRQVLGETHECVDKKVRQYMKELHGFVATESVLDEERQKQYNQKEEYNEYPNQTPENQETVEIDVVQRKGTETHEDRFPLQDASCEEEVEGEVPPNGDNRA